MGVTDNVAMDASDHASRNTQEEESGRLIHGLRAEVDWRAFHERHHKKDKARRTGSMCGNCFEELGPDDEVYRVREYERFLPMGKDCAPQWMVQRSYVPAKVVPRTLTYEWECAGGCGRTVVFG